MPIEVQQSAVKVASAEPFFFTFNNSVMNYCVGISAFQITYSNQTDNWIRSLAIQISSAVGDSKTVSGQVSIRMEDDSQHSADASSFVVPVCIAVTELPDHNTTIGNQPEITTKNPRTVPFPNQGSSGVIYGCFQSGFDLSFAQKDHQVLTAYASCNLVNSGSEQGLISSMAGMEDGNGNQVDAPTVDAGYIATLRTSPVALNYRRAQTLKPTSITIDGWRSVGAAIAIITDWQVRFPSVNNIQTITVGAWGDQVFNNISISGNTVTIPQLYSGISDHSNHAQDDSQSHCGVQIVAVPGK